MFRWLVRFGWREERWVKLLEELKRRRRHSDSGGFPHSVKPLEELKPT
jgi:hypothetical protein